MEYGFEIVKARIYVNKCAKTLTAIQKETGADVLINGGLYDMKYKDRPNLWLRVDGQTLHTDNDGYWCYGWDVSDFRMIHSQDIETVQNAICCTSLVKDSKKTILKYDSGQGGVRGRSAVGTLPDGRIVIFCSKDGTSLAMTPEKMQEYCLEHGWKDAIMLDSGGSSQCITPDGEIASTRKVHNVLCFWLKTDTTEGEDSMTETEVRNKVVNTAKKYLGCNEGDGSHKQIIDTYNAHKPLVRGYSVKYTDEWCATFVSMVSILCGYNDIMPTECSCTQMIELYKKLGRWQESDSYTPKPGDIIMYDWNDSGVGDNKGAPDHVGIVAAINGTNLTIIEGNKNESVAYRAMSVNGKFIRGYCVPEYSKKVNQYTLKRFVMDVQSVTGSKVDGIAGNETLSNTLTVSAVLNRKHPVVYCIQRRLKALGYTQVGTVDGVAGGKFTAAVKAFQKDNGCVADGEVTARAKTWKKLLGMA